MELIDRFGNQASRTSPVGLTFDFSPETGYTGLVTGKPAAVIYARGGEYPAETEMAAFDLQKPYIETWLRFIGFTEIESIVIEPTLDPVRAEDVLETAMESARELAARFHGVGSPYEESIA